MSSAFFKRPGGDSSDSSSDEEGTEELDHSQKSTGTAVDPDIDLANTESLSTETSIADHHRMETQEESVPLNVDTHKDVMFASLLEDFCKTRAAELINAGSPGSIYHRLSAEAQPLARKLYEEASQALASNGFIPSSVISKDLSSVRNQYLVGLNNLSMRSLGDQDLTPVKDGKHLMDEEQNMALVNVGRRGSADLVKAFEPPVSSILMETGRMSISSAHSDVQMTFGRSSRSHYESSFQQMRLLGKGGFGRVYHAYNIFDQKEYAVKKIPLSQKLSERYKKSGHQELESVLREVQALAQLEHSNCVRYHACWVEEPQSPTGSPSPRPSPAYARPNQRLLEHRPPLSEESPPRMLKSSPIPVSGVHSDGIVFGYDTTSHQSSRELRPNAKDWSAAGTTRDSAPARESEIFTDGQARASDLSDTSIDHSVYVLHVQMSLHPLTLTQYLAPISNDSTSALSSPPRRHCFHLVPSLRILLGILCGLQYIHAKGLIHRDIKPSNIFLSTAASNDNIALSEGYWDIGSCPSCPDQIPFYVNPRIGDFGLVAGLAQSTHSSRHSAGGRPVGTELYRPPPDVISYGITTPAVDEHLDVFALGVILVEMLCAFPTSSERVHVLRDLQHERMPSGFAVVAEAEGFASGLGRRVEECIRGMIRGSSRERWGCAKVKEEVEGILGACACAGANAAGEGEGQGEMSVGFDTLKVSNVSGTKDGR